MKSTMNMEAVPHSPNEMQFIDSSEKEYNRMISQQMMHHKVMMEDLMKLSTETETGSNLSLQPQDQAQMQRQMSVVAGLGNTVETMNTSNKQLLELANKKSKQGDLNAQAASTFNASIKEINANLHNDVMAYDALKQEGFSNNHNNHSMNAALDNSAVVLESQKYALALFGAFSIYLLYKTVKYL